MATLEVLVLPVDDIYDHPNADRLSIVRIRGYEAITNKLEDGSHRYAKGELIVYVPEGAQIPHDVIKERGYWDVEKDRGMLAGKQGDRVKAIKLRGVVSQGLVWKLRPGSFMSVPMLYADRENHPEGGENRTGGKSSVGVLELTNLADFFGITKYEPPVPMGMGGQVASLHECRFEFDVENLQNYPTFLASDIVEATEKLHGTFCRISYYPGMDHPELFGGNVAIASKGLGAKGLVFKDVEENRVGNVYVRTALELGLIDKLRAYGDEFESGNPIHLLGEVFGRGVQDLAYGESKPTFRAFDIARTVGSKIVFEDPTWRKLAFEHIGVERAPVLYFGAFDLEALTALRDGKTTLNGGTCIREGIVLTAIGDQAKRQTDLGGRLRPFLKMVSPDYLTRKGEVTEYS